MCSLTVGHCVSSGYLASFLLKVVCKGGATEGASVYVTRSTLLDEEKLATQIFYRSIGLYVTA